MDRQITFTPKSPNLIDICDLGKKREEYDPCDTIDQMA
jgi:hypothetical protein